MRFKIGGKRRLLGPGDGEVVFGPSVKHAAKHTSGNDTLLRAETCPAGDVQDFLEAFAAAARAGFYTRRGIPKSPQGAVELVRLLPRFRHSTVISGPPRLLQPSRRADAR